ncbi:MAG: hypothetical protein JWM20_178 [Patescibacteria group bacterium]|nr:hypothetical protein [Patescibacteria group bacterium]
MNRNTAIVVGIIGLVAIAAIVLAIVKTGNPAPTNVIVTPLGTPASTDTGTNGSTPSKPSAQPSAPSVITGSSSTPSDTAAIVAGTISPNGAFTSYWFEYGTSSNLGSKTPNQSVGSGYATTSAPGYITGLAKSTKYYFRLVAENQYGRTNGTTYSFQTTMGTPAPAGTIPAVSTRAANDIARNSASLNGSVIPNGVQTNYWFEYGTTTSLNNTTSLVSAGSGTSAIAASIPVYNLNPLTTYYFRIDAQNQFGTVSGTIQNFKTSGPAAPTAPSVTTRSATGITATAATLRGTVNPDGAGTSYWFEYTIDPSFATGVTNSAQQSAGSGTSSDSIQSTVSGLNSRTTYYFRLVAQNSVGTTLGDSMSFRTK